MEKISYIENMVDTLGQPKASGHRRRKSNKTLKVIGVFAIVVMLASVSVATYLTYFAKFDKQLTVTQSVTVDGHNWNEPFTYAGTISAGCCEIDGPHTIKNNGCEGIWLDFATTETSNPVQSLDGIDVKVVRCEEPQPPEPCYLEQLVIVALDGVNENTDDFEVFVDDELVFTYDAVGGGVENWVTHTIPLLSYNLVSGNNVVKIVATSSMWQYFNPYGQLGIDSVALYYDCPTCPEPQLCGIVDIGNPTSEAAVTKLGWGPIEPATHGGTWGGINDCRATWFYEDLQNDESWASITFVCPDCTQPQLDAVKPNECDCDDPEMKLPFYLAPGESFDFCIIYKADMLLQPSVYNIQTLLIPSVQA